MFLDPIFARLEAGAQFLAAGPPPYPRHPFAVGFPVEFEAEEGEAPGAGRAEAAEAVDSGFIRGDFEAEFGQPFGEFPIESLRFVLLCDFPSLLHLLPCAPITLVFLP